MIDEELLVEQILSNLKTRPGNLECAEQASEIIRIIKSQQRSDEWNPIDKKMPKYDGEYEVTVRTLPGFRKVAPGVLLNIRMVYVSGKWKSQWFQEIHYYQVLAWKEIAEPFMG
nr:hypothetical protein [uncultured Clostridium sp.]